MKGARSAVAFWGWLDGFAGVSKEGFFGPPSWVDTGKPAGHTSQTELLGFGKSWRSIWTQKQFFFSPNLIWFAIALAFYVCFPYDLEAAAKGWSWGWVSHRIAVTYGLSLAYYGFFYWALYVRGLAKRKFRPGVYPTLTNMAHDLWYWHLGILQWSLTDCAMMRLWATGRVGYVSGSELLGSPKDLLITAICVVLVPVWRDIHFYFAHRFSHIRAIYRYVHSLHHRNTDPEPFSGLCMHPVEHMIYFSNALTPTLYLRLHPFIFLWIFVHLGIAPGAGHSGWEDHWQADQYHYVHHAKFECNYGSPSSGWLDQLFGTFREKLGNSEAYAGAYKDDYAKPAAGKVWSAQSKLGLQERDHFAYTCFCLAATAALFWAAVFNVNSPAPVRHVGSLPIGSAVAILVAYGPVVAALLLSAVYDKMGWRWPFHKERVLGAFGFFAVAGWASTLLPVYHFVQLLCAV